MGIDRAGEQYWNRNWQLGNQTGFRPNDRRARHAADRQIAALLGKALAGYPESSAVLEAGCADSSVLPYVARVFGMRITGIDYSPVGCERFGERIREAGVDATIECCDIFEPPPHMVGSFDVVFSIGLVEHFDDTARCVRALRLFLRPGGTLLTVIPNMHGATGALQRIVAPSVFQVHVQLTPQDLDRAHRAAGLIIMESGYCMPSGFGMVNFAEPGSSRPGYWLRRLAIAGLARLSWLTWFVDERIVRLPRSRALSPYGYCIATLQPEVV